MKIIRLRKPLSKECRKVVAFNRSFSARIVCAQVVPTNYYYVSVLWLPFVVEVTQLNHLFHKKVTYSVSDCFTKRLFYYEHNQVLSKHVYKKHQKVYEIGLGWLRRKVVYYTYEVLVGSDSSKGIFVTDLSIYGIEE